MENRSLKIIIVISVILTFLLPANINASINDDSSSPDSGHTESINIFDDLNKRDSYSQCSSSMEHDQTLNENLITIDPRLANVQSQTEIFDNQCEYSDRVRSISNLDGTRTTEINIEPSYYCDPLHGQKYIDTTIEPMRFYNEDDKEIDIINKLDYQYRSVKNNLKIYFRNQYEPRINRDIFKLTDKNDQNPLQWQPVGLAINPDDVIDDIQNLKNIMNNFNLGNTDSLIDENKIVYSDIFPGCDDQYMVLTNELKHNLIINEDFDLDQINSLILGSSEEKTDLDRDYHRYLDYYGIFTIPIDIDIYTSSDSQPEYGSFITDNDIILKNGNNAVYSITKPFAFEQDNDQNNIQCQYLFIPLEFDLGQVESTPTTDNKVKNYLLITRTDLSWLLDDDRNYPVIIDPNIELPLTGEKGMDTYLVKGNSTLSEYSNHNFGSHRELKVSLAGPSLYSRENLYYRSILKFPGIKLISSRAQILEAKLILQSKSSDDNSLAITVFRLFDDWKEGNGTESSPGSNGASWNHSGHNVWLGGNYNGYNIDAKTTIITSPTYYIWNVLDIVRFWIKDPSTNHGFLLTGTDYEDVVKVFHSSEAVLPGLRPKLTIRYNTPPVHTGLDEIIVHEDDKKVVDMNDIFEDPDIINAAHEDSLSFRIWDGTYKIENNKNSGLKFVETGVYSSKNLTVELRTDNKLHITPAGAEVDGTDVVPMQVKDRYISNWVEVPITFRIQATNDPPKVISVGGKSIYDDTVELSATEGLAEDFMIIIDDPDNPEFYEENIKNVSEGAPGDLEFRFEQGKSEQFVISEAEDEENGQYGLITFNPTNDLVGIFYINVTVYDTYYYYPTDYSRKTKKFEVSNHTIMVIFDIENVNNPPTNIKIIEPKKTEFSADDIITFKGRSKDPDLLIPDSDETLLYLWDSSLDGPLGEGTEIQTKLSKGKHEINLTVRDSENELKVKSIEISVRNRATIPAENCTNQFSDTDSDVLGYYYFSEAETGEKEFYIMRESSYPEYDIFVDITDLSSKRFNNYLFVNLTFKEDIRLHLDSDNYRYRFSIYLLKPGHDEAVTNIKNTKYNPRQYEALYAPDKSMYYGVFGYEDGTLVNKGRTLSIKKHLGDLENGEGIQQRLKGDFSIFATAKVELKQRLLDGSFENLICYDSVGFGSKPAPQPQQTAKVEQDDGSSSDLNVELILVTIVIILIVVFSFIFYQRKKKLEEEREAQMTLDTTQQLPMQMQMQMPMQMQMQQPFGFGSPHGSMGIGMGMGGMNMDSHGTAGMPPMVPMLPPAQTNIPGFQTTQKTNKSTKKWGLKKTK